MNWMKRIVFKAHLGTDEDKATLAYELASTNPDVIKAILSRCMSKMSCVYLFNVGKMKSLDPMMIHCLRFNAAVDRLAASSTRSG